MDTEFLETFIAVADGRSIASAARSLGLTPGAVSLRLKALEAEFGFRLIERSGRSVTPTKDAATLLNAARNVVRDARALKSLALDADGQLRGDVRLGAISTAITGTLPALLSALARDQPAITMFIEPGTSLELYGRVVAGELDGAILVAPPLGLRKDESFSPWLTERLVLIAPTIWAARRPVSLLRTAPFIRYDRRNWGGRLVDAYLKRTDIKPVERYELDALDGIVAMVSAGLGVAIIPDWAGPRLEGVDFAKLALPPPAVSRVVGLFHRKGSARRGLIEVVDAIHGQTFPRAE